MFHHVQHNDAVLVSVQLLRRRQPRRRRLLVRLLLSSELVPPAVNLADGKSSTKMSRRWRPLPTSASTPSKWLEDRPSSLPKTTRALEEGEENEQRWEKGDGQRREKGGGPIGAKSSFQACW